MLCRGCEGRGHNYLHFSLRLGAALHEDQAGHLIQPQGLHVWQRLYPGCEVEAALGRLLFGRGGHPEGVVGNQGGLLGDSAGLLCRFLVRLQGRVCEVILSDVRGDMLLELVGFDFILFHERLGVFSLEVPLYSAVRPHITKQFN